MSESELKALIVEMADIIEGHLTGLFPEVVKRARDATGSPGIFE